MDTNDATLEVLFDNLLQYTINSLNNSRYHSIMVKYDYSLQTFEIFEGNLQ